MSTSYFEASFCEGETYSFNQQNYSEGGSYEVILFNSFGCDSLIQFELTEIAIGPGVSIPESIDIELGESLILKPVVSDPKWVNFSWLDEENQIVGSQADIDIQSIVHSTTLILESKDINGCVSLDSIYINVDKSNIRLYIPNVFTPQSNSINDRFRTFGSISLSKIQSFQIYDRWGNMVHEENEILEINELEGWNGIINGQYAEVGVYAYKIVAEFLDGSIQTFSGDMTLIR